jgi:pyruvate ferredoxin oxidoreductase alpha subunit
MSRVLLTGNAAAAWAARLADVDYIPAFPITPQTEIIETLSEWIDNGEMPGRLVTLDSEHSMLTAAGAAAATGVRVFTATSSQGLLYAMEMLYNVAGWRVPMVLVNVSRGLSAPITLEPDHNDVLAARDSGFLQIHCATCQEVLDSVLMAYRLAEDTGVRLPVLVNMDGFYLSFTREPVSIPDKAKVKAFLPAFDPKSLHFRASTPESQAVAVLGGGPYSYFRYETHLAAMNALQVYQRIAGEFEHLVGRSYPVVDAYQVEDADYLFVMMGSFATKAMGAVDSLREAGWKIGLLRLRLLRPLPKNRLQELSAGRKAMAIIDQSISMGGAGILYNEIAGALYDMRDNAPVLASFTGGLGGRDIPPEEFFEIARVLRNAGRHGEAPPPRLLYTEDELRQTRKLQAIARVERQELNGENDE